MKIVLIGYPGSQLIVPASKYLTSKYLQHIPRILGFDITYLNYKGDINGWSKYIAGYLQYLTDENVIIALDDYLVADYIKVDKFEEAEKEMGGDVMCIKLCKCSEEEHKQYPVTTQYTIWNREFLIWLLGKITTPWDFELRGSQIFDLYLKTALLRPCIDYFTNSSLSGRWEGINLEGLKEQDINYMRENGIINT